MQFFFFFLLLETKQQQLIPLEPEKKWYMNFLQSSIYQNGVYQGKIFTW